jgi:hypothetical protein
MRASRIADELGARVHRATVDRRLAAGLDLAREHVEEPRVSARGMARLTELLTDGRSPLYCPAPRGSKRAALRQTRATLLLG